MRIALYIALMFGSVSFFGCDKKKKSNSSSEEQPAEEENDDDDETKEADAEPTPPPEEPKSTEPTVSGSKIMSFTKLKETCNENFGLVWSAEEKTCAEPMTPYPCCNSSVINRFPSLKSQINNFMEKNQGYELYNCGQSDSQTTLYVIQIDNGYKYAQFSINAISGDPASSDDCSKAVSPARPDKDFPPYDNSVDGFERD